jgi:hypothetical protein
MYIRPVQGYTQYYFNMLVQNFFESNNVTGTKITMLFPYQFPRSLLFWMRQEIQSPLVDQNIILSLLCLKQFQQDNP